MQEETENGQIKDNDIKQRIGALKRQLIQQASVSLQRD